MNHAGLPRSVTLYGTGLIGSSFALALKNANPAIRIFGVDTPETLKVARTLRIVEAADPSTSEPPDLAILATPVGAILELVSGLPPGPRLIMDVGSTKVQICAAAERRRLPFVGGHPMTGLERSGPEAATPELFRGAPFFLCPVSTTPEEALAAAQAVVEGIGATPCVTTPESHDRMVAQLSHLPQLLSTLLADHTHEPQAFAGPGWKSVTRLAASPFHVWRDILRTSGFLPQELQAFLARLQEVAQLVEAGKIDDLEQIFDRANRRVSGGNCE